MFFNRYTRLFFYGVSVVLRKFELSVISPIFIKLVPDGLVWFYEWRVNFYNKYLIVFLRKYFYPAYDFCAVPFVWFDETFYIPLYRLWLKIPAKRRVYIYYKTRFWISIFLFLISIYFVCYSIIPKLLEMYGADIDDYLYHLRCVFWRSRFFQKVKPSWYDTVYRHDVDYYMGPECADRFSKKYNNPKEWAAFYRREKARQEREIRIVARMRIKAAKQKLYRQQRIDYMKRARAKYNTNFAKWHRGTFGQIIKNQRIQQQRRREFLREMEAKRRRYDNDYDDDDD
jgi:hypothetical protein